MSSFDVIGSNLFCSLGQHLASVRNAAQSGLDLLEQDAEAALEHNQNLQEIKQFAPVVTIVGQVKAGKTALTNAIARCPDLLPSNVNPWTSAVTALHLNRPDQSEHAEFSFMSREDWDSLRNAGGKLGELANRAGIIDEADRLAKQVDELRAQAVNQLGTNFEMLLGSAHRFDNVSSELIERYVCLAGEDEGDGKNAGRYANITKLADIYLSPQPEEMPLVLRDTPGVNDPFLVREHVTLRALRDSDICVLTLSAGQALTMSDVGMLRILFALRPEQVIIFVNRIDELQEPETQTSEIVDRIEETLSQLQINTVPKIIFGCAAWANAAQAGHFDDLTPASRTTLEGLSKAQKKDPEDAAWDLSGVPALLAEIARAAPETVGGRVLRNAAQRITSALRQKAHLGEATLAQEERALDINQLVSELDPLIDKSIDALEKQAKGREETFKTRFDAAIEQVLEEEGKRLTTALESSSKEQWAVDGFRMRHLVSEAYNSTISEYQISVKKLFRSTAVALNKLKDKVSGKMKDSVIELPELIDPNAPIAIAASLALDMNQSWWSRWMGRDRFAQKAHQALGDLVRGEAAVVYNQLNHENFRPLAESELEAMKSVLSEQCSALCDLADRTAQEIDTEQLAEEVKNMTEAANKIQASIEAFFDPGLLKRVAAE